MLRHLLRMLSFSNRHEKSIQVQLTVHAPLHRPADDLTRKQINDGSQQEPALMRPKVRNIGDPNAVQLSNINLLLQVLRRYSRGFPFATAWTSVITRLGAQQRTDTIAPAGFTQIALIIMSLSIPVNGTAFQPRLFDVSKQATVLDTAR